MTWRSHLILFALLLPFGGVFATVSAVQSDVVNISYMVVAGPSNWEVPGSSTSICRIYEGNGLTPAVFVVADGRLGIVFAEEELSLGRIVEDRCEVVGSIQVPRADLYEVKITSRFSQQVTIEKASEGRLDIQLLEGPDVVNPELLPLNTPPPTEPATPTERPSPEGIATSTADVPDAYPDTVLNADGTPIPYESALHLRVTQPRPDFLSGFDGEDCGFDTGDVVFSMAPLQLVVKDQSDSIVETQNIYGEVNNSSYGNNCEAQLWIELPAAEFYSVYLGDRFLRTYKAADFPLDPNEGISLQLPEWGSMG